MHPKNLTKTPKLMLLWCWTINWESGINVALLVAQLLFGSRLLILINFAQLHIDIPSLGWTSTLHTFIWLNNMLVYGIRPQRGYPRLFALFFHRGGGQFNSICFYGDCCMKSQFNLQSWIVNTHFQASATDRTLAVSHCAIKSNLLTIINEDG